MSRGCATPFWLPGSHLQTIYPLLRKPALPRLRRERIDTPDGDFIDLDWLTGAPANAPLVVLFHGLEGSSRSHYARSLMQAAQARGWQAVMPHFRGCSGTPNRLARAYHSGDSEEIDWILALLAKRCSTVPRYAIGVSLGGNALLKWLGERGDTAGDILLAAAAVCPPLDLTVSGAALGHGFNLVYTRHFLNTLKPKALAKVERHPGLFDPQRLIRAQTLRAFDDAYTAPAHGFRDVDDYWQRASSRPWLRHIRLRTLLLTAANDPFVPAAALPSADDLAPNLSHEHLPDGGHGGFVSGRWPGHLDWLPNRLLDFLASQHL
jgi:predicted alpha/beta-fold hydrolase